MTLMSSHKSLSHTGCNQDTTTDTEMSKSLFPPKLESLFLAVLNQQFLKLYMCSRCIAMVTKTLSHAGSPAD